MWQSCLHNNDEILLKSQMLLVDKKPQKFVQKTMAVVPAVQLVIRYIGSHAWLELEEKQNKSRVTLLFNCVK